MVNNLLEAAEGRTYSTAIKSGLYIVFKLISFSLLPEKKKKKPHTQILDHENNPGFLLCGLISQAQVFIGVLSAAGFGHVNMDKMR